MSKCVVNAHRRVRKRHGRDASRVVHHGSRLLMVWLLVGNGQVLESEPNCLHGIRVGIGRSKTRNCRLQSMSQAINPCVGGESLRHGHNELRINNGNVWTERVVGQSYLAPMLFIEEHGEWSDLASRSACGR